MIFKNIKTGLTWASDSDEYVRKLVAKNKHLIIIEPESTPKPKTTPKSKK